MARDAELTVGACMAGDHLIVLVDEDAELLDLLILLRRQHVADLRRQLPAQQTCDSAFDSLPAWLYIMPRFAGCRPNAKRLSIQVDNERPYNRVMPFQAGEPLEAYRLVTLPEPGHVWRQRTFAPTHHRRHRQSGTRTCNSLPMRGA